MNRLDGKVQEVVVEGNLSLIKVAVQDIFLHVLVIETPDTVSYLQQGKELCLMCKETEVILAHHHCMDLSIPNRIPCTIQKITEGTLLSKVELQFDHIPIAAIVLNQSLANMKLKEGDPVIAMVKVTEVMVLAN